MEIYKKISLVMAEIGHIEKSSRNATQGYAFRGIDAVQEAFQPVLAKHGVFCAPNVIKQEREERQTKAGGALIYTILTIEFSFFCGDGSFVKVTTVGEAMDSGDKSANKAMSAALKYALTHLFCVPTDGDNDTENNSPDPLSKAQRIQSQVERKPVVEQKKFEPAPIPVNPINLIPSQVLAPDHPLANYEFPNVAKKFFGRKLGDISANELIDYKRYMTEYLTKDSKPIAGKWKELLDNIDIYTTGF